MQGNYSVNFHPNAEKEFIASVQWYGHSRKDLGNEFMIGIRKVIDLIEQNPFLFPIKNKNFREALVTKFPYFIIY